MMQNKKVLIVEDERLIATLLERRLNQFGYTVIGSYSTGELAVEKTLKLLPDLVLMDISLKGEIDGINATIEIKKHLDIPIIYITSYSDDETLERAKETKPAGYLIKPIDEKELKTILDITFNKYELDCKLRGAEKQFEYLFDLSNDCCFTINTKGYILNVNLIGLEQLGFEKEELVFSKFDNLICFDSQSDKSSFIQNLFINNESKQTTSITLRKKNGEQIFFEMNSMVISHKGDVHSILCVLKNKNEIIKEQSEKLLKEKEETLIKQNNVLNNLIKRYLPFKLDLMEVLQEFTKVTTEVLNIEKTGVWLYSSDHTKMECLCLFDKLQDNYITGEIIHTVKYPSFFDTLDDEGVIAAVNARDDMHTNDTSIGSLNKFSVDSSLCASIICSGEEIGVLCCEPSKMKQRWSAEEESFVTSVSDLISLAFGEYERKNTVDLLETSEKKNKAFIDVIPDLMFRISNEGIFLDYKCDNDNTLFLEPVEILGKKCSEVFPPDLAELIDTYVKQTLSSNRIHTFDYFLEFNEGRRYFESRMVPYGDQEVLAIIRDVTDNKRNELLLKETNENLESKVQERTEELVKLNKLLQETQIHQKALLDSIPDIAWLKNTEYKYIAINKKLSDQLGIEPDYIVGKTDFDFYNHSIAEKYLSFDKKVINTGIPLRYEDEIEIENNNVKWVETIKVPIFNKEGIIVGTAGSSRDITERKLAEKILEKSNEALERLVVERTANLQLAIDELKDEIKERRKIEDELKKLSFAVEQSPASIIITDLNGNIEYTNPKFSEITGYLKEEVLDKNPKILKSGLNPEDLYKNLWECITTGVEWRGELYNKKKNGELFWEFAIISPIKNSFGIATHYLAVKEDISERKNSENALRESEKRFRLLYEKAPLSYQSLDIDGNIVDVNTAWLETMGYSREDTIGKWFGSYLIPQYKEKFLKDFQTILLKGELYGSEYELICKDNSTITIQISARTGYDNYGRFKQAYCILFNITERKQMESKLIESEERYRKLVEFSPDGIFLLSNSKLVYVNRAGLALVGVNDYSEIIGHSIIDFVPENYKVYFNDRMNILIKEDKEITITEGKFKNIQGEEIDVEILSVPISNKENPAIQIIARNISERKQSENAVRLSEERFRTIFENSPVGISISLNSDIKYANEAFLRMFGYQDFNEVNGKSIFSLIVPESRKDVINDMINRMKGGHAIQTYECYGIRKDESQFPFHIEITYLDLPEGRAVVAFYTDVSEQMLKEEQIRSSLREKEILLKEIHHRVKNNLQIISSLLSLQSEYIKDNKMYSLFNESINRIKSMALIHERLYQSKNFSSIDFSEYVSDITNYLFRIYQASTNKIKLKLEIEPIYISIDTAIPCGFIINELVSNSLKYAFFERETGLVKISFRTDKKNCATLMVSDNGIGLPENFNLQDITSLGLQLVQNLIDQLEGKIEIKNDNGTKIIMKFNIFQ